MVKNKGKNNQRDKKQNNYSELSGKSILTKKITRRKVRRDCTGIIVDETKIKSYIICEDKKTTWEKNFKLWKYKLRLGDEVYLSTDDLPKALKNGEFIIIKPGDFALLITKEEVHLPKNVMAFISMRFDYKQKGLINVSGFHVDPCYKGKLIFSAFNAGAKDIVIRKGDAVFMIFFQSIYGNVDEREGGYSCIPADMIEQIRGRSVTLASNATRLDKMEFYLKIIGGLLATVLSILLGVALREAFKS